VLDDIDLLAAQLADDGLHAHPFHPDAGAHAVHVAVARQYSDLGALAGLARARLDGHRTVVNFRHFLLEEAHDELRRAARHHHPRATAEFIHVLDHTADSVAGSEALRPRLLAPRETRLGPAEIDDEVRSLGALHHASDQLADAAGELP